MKKGNLLWLPFFIQTVLILYLLLGLISVNQLRFLFWLSLFDLDCRLLSLDLTTVLCLLTRSTWVCLRETNGSGHGVRAFIYFFRHGSYKHRF